MCELYGRQVQIVLYEEPHSGLGGSINLEEPTHPLKTPESLSLACPKLLLHCFEVVCESRACPKVLLHKKKGRQMCSIHCDKKEFKSRLSESARSKIIVTMHLSYTCEQTNKCLHAVMPTVDITKKNAMDHSSTNFFFLHIQHWPLQGGEKALDVSSLRVCGIYWSFFDMHIDLF